MRNWLHALLGGDQQNNINDAAFGISTGTDAGTSKPLWKSWWQQPPSTITTTTASSGAGRVHPLSSPTGGRRVDDSTEDEEAGYRSPGVLDPGVRHELQLDAGLTVSGKPSQGPSATLAPQEEANEHHHEEDDDAVDDFLQSVIAGKTDVLRKQLAQQKLEAAAAAAAAALTHSKSAGDGHGHGAGARAGEKSGQVSPQPSAQPSFAMPSGDPKHSASAVVNALQQQPQPHRRHYVSSAARSLQDYELIAFLGSGTFAEVTLARNKVTHEYFAVKKISKQRVKEEGCVERTFTERQLLANLHHPFLVRLYQAFQSQTHLYLVLDFAQGGDLYYVNAQQLWLRSMKRTLVKMQYPYYQSTSSSFPVVPMPAESRWPQGLPASPTTANPHLVHSHDRQYHHDNVPSKSTLSTPSPSASSTQASMSASSAVHRHRSQHRNHHHHHHDAQLATPLPSTPLITRPPLRPVGEASVAAECSKSLIPFIHSPGEGERTDQLRGKSVMMGTTMTAASSFSATPAPGKDSSSDAPGTGDGALHLAEHTAAPLTNWTTTTTGFTNPATNAALRSALPTASRATVDDDEVDDGVEDSESDYTEHHHSHNNVAAAAAGPIMSGRGTRLSVSPLGDVGREASAGGTARLSGGQAEAAEDLRYYTTDAVDEFEPAVATRLTASGAIAAAGEGLPPRPPLPGGTTKSTGGAMESGGAAAAVAGDGEGPSRFFSSTTAAAAGGQDGGEAATPRSPLQASASTACGTAAAGTPVTTSVTVSALTPMSSVSRPRYRHRRVERTGTSTAATMASSSSSDDDGDGVLAGSSGAEGLELSLSLSHGSGRVRTHLCSSTNSVTGTAPGSSTHTLPIAGPSRLPPSLVHPAAAARRRQSNNIAAGGGPSSVRDRSSSVSSLAGTPVTRTPLGGTPASFSGLPSSPAGFMPPTSPIGAARLPGMGEGLRRGLVRDGESASLAQTQRSRASTAARRSEKASLDYAVLARTTDDTSLAAATAAASQRRKKERKKKKQQRKNSKRTEEAPESTTNGEGISALVVPKRSGSRHSKRKARNSVTVSVERNSDEAPSSPSPISPAIAVTSTDDAVTAARKRHRKMAPLEPLITDSASTADRTVATTGSPSFGSQLAHTPAQSPTTTRSFAAVAAREAAAIAAAAHIDLAAPFTQVGMEDSPTVLRSLPRSQLAPDESHRFPIRLIAFYAVEVALVLQYLHGEGFLYRDLKPENILMRSDGHVMLTDFGVAKYRKGATIATATKPAEATIGTAASTSTAAAAGNTTAGGGVGTPAGTLDGKANSFTGTTQYMSPEMLRGLPHDSRTDWWSYGCLLFEWANGRKAFEGANQFSLFRSIVEEDVKVTEEDYRLMPLEVHSRVAQLHYRSQEVRLEYEERAARRMRRRGMPTGVPISTHGSSPPQNTPRPLAAEVVYNRDSHSFDVRLLASAPQQQNSSSDVAKDAHSPNSASRLGRASVLVPSSPPQQRHQQQHDASHSGRGVFTNAHRAADASMSADGAVAALLNDSFANSRMMASSPGGEGAAAAGLLHGAGRHFGDSFGHGSFAGLAHNSIFSLGGTPSNLSLRLAPTEDGGIAALVSSTSPAALRRQQQEERLRRNRVRRARLSCLAMEPAVRDMYVDDAVHQMEEAQRLLKDLTLKLLDRRVEHRLSGDSVLDHPFFTCPYVVSQLYYRVYQERALAKGLRRSMRAMGLNANSFANSFSNSLRDEMLNGGESFPRWAGMETGTPQPGSFATPSAAFPSFSSFVALPAQHRPEDWRELFLDRQIASLYTPRVRTRDDLRYFPAAVTATGLSAAVEQHRRIKEVKEQQKELMRATKATMLNACNGGAGHSGITGTLSAAHSQLCATLQAAGDSVMVVPMDAEAAEQMQQLLTHSLHDEPLGSPDQVRMSSGERQEDSVVTPDAAIGTGGSGEDNTRCTTAPGRDSEDNTRESAEPFTVVDNDPFYSAISPAAATAVPPPALYHLAPSLVPDHSVVDPNAAFQMLEEDGEGEELEMSPVHRRGVVTLVAASGALQDNHQLIKEVAATTDSKTKGSSNSTSATAGAGASTATTESCARQGDAAEWQQTPTPADSRAGTPTASTGTAAADPSLPRGRSFITSSSSSTGLLSGGGVVDSMNAEVSRTGLGAFSPSSGAADNLEALGVASVGTSSDLFDRAATLPQSFVDAAVAAAAAAQKRYQQQQQQQLHDMASAKSSSFILPLDGEGSPLTATTSAYTDLTESRTSAAAGGDATGAAGKGATAARSSARAMEVTVPPIGRGHGPLSDSPLTAPLLERRAATTAADAFATLHTPVATLKAVDSKTPEGTDGLEDTSLAASGLGDSPGQVSEFEVGGGGGYYEQDALAEEQHGSVETGTEGNRKVTGEVEGEGGVEVEEDSGLVLPTSVRMTRSDSSILHIHNEELTSPESSVPYGRHLTRNNPLSPRGDDGCSGTTSEMASTLSYSHPTSATESPTLAPRNTFPIVIKGLEERFSTTATTTTTTTTTGLTWNSASTPAIEANSAGSAVIAYDQGGVRRPQDPGNETIAPERTSFSSVAGASPNSNGGLPSVGRRLSIAVEDASSGSDTSSSLPTHREPTTAMDTMDCTSGLMPHAHRVPLSTSSSTMATPRTAEDLEKSVPSEGGNALDTPLRTREGSLDTEVALAATCIAHGDVPSLMGPEIPCATEKQSVEVATKKEINENEQEEDEGAVDEAGYESSCAGNDTKSGDTESGGSSDGSSNSDCSSCSTSVSSSDEESGEKEAEEEGEQQMPIPAKVGSPCPLLLSSRTSPVPSPQQQSTPQRTTDLSSNHNNNCEESDVRSSDDDSDLSSTVSSLLRSSTSSRLTSSTTSTSVLSSASSSTHYGAGEFVEDAITATAAAVDGRSLHAMPTTSSAMHLYVSDAIATAAGSSRVQGGSPVGRLPRRCLNTGASGGNAQSDSSNGADGVVTPPHSANSPGEGSGGSGMNLHMGYESSNGSRLFGDTFTGEIFGPLTTLSGVAYNLEEEMGSSSSVSTPLLDAHPTQMMAPSHTTPPPPPQLQQQRDGRAKTMWAQQQRQRINRERQNSAAQQKQQPPPAQTPEEEMPLPSSVFRPNAGRQGGTSNGGFGSSHGSAGNGPRGGGLGGQDASSSTDEFFGFTFNDRGSGGAGMLQRARGRELNPRGGGDDDESFDPFRSNNDVNRAKRQQQQQLQSAYGGGDGDAGRHRGQRAITPATGASLLRPPLRGSPPLQRSDDSDEERDLRAAPSPSLNLSTGTGTTGSPPDMASGVVGGFGSGFDHFQNFSFTSPQILQQYLASTNANGGSGDRGGGRPNYGSRGHRTHMGGGGMGNGGDD